MQTDGNSCSICRFFRADEYPLGYGGCHRYPGQLAYFPTLDSAEERRRAHFPPHKPDEWCGEFKPTGGP